MSDPPIVVVGASSGGVEALLALARQLPPELPAAVCIVLHQPPRVPSALARLLDRAGVLPADHAQDNDPLEAGRLYVAPPDLHLVVEPGRLRLVHGPLENGFRPAVDPLFRTAAGCYGPGVVAVVLSGSLDDGSAGAAAVKSEGGAVVIQDPADALYPEMPQNALHAVGEVDGMAAVGALGDVLVPLVRRAAAAEVRPVRVPDVDPVAQPVGSADHLDPVAAEALTCPSCNGPLIEGEWGADARVRFHCRVGHGWSLESLAAAQASNVEEGLWTAVRVLEERAALCRRLAQRAEQRGQLRAVEGFRREIDDTEEHARHLRALIAGVGPLLSEIAVPDVREPDGERQAPGDGARSAR